MLPRLYRNEDGTRAGLLAGMSKTEPHRSVVCVGKADTACSYWERVFRNSLQTFARLSSLFDCKLES